MEAVVAAVIHYVTANCACKNGGVHFAADFEIHATAALACTSSFAGAVLHSAVHLFIQKIMYAPRVRDVQWGKHVLLNEYMHG